MIDGPHVGHRMMAPTAVGGLLNPQPGERVAVMHADRFEHYHVEIVDPIARTAKHVRRMGQYG